MFIPKDPFNIIIGGVGGQGNVLASQILGRVLVAGGRVVTIGETYGASQRGGPVMSHLRVSAGDPFSPLIPEGQCDLLVSLEPVEALRILGRYGNPAVQVLTNVRTVQPLDVLSGDASYPELDTVLAALGSLSRRLWRINATEIALEMGDPILANMVILGALAHLEVLPFTRRAFQEALEGVLPDSRMEENLEAFDRGARAVEELV